MTKHYCRTVWPWWYDGCQRWHVGRVDRHQTEDGKSYCVQKYFRVLDERAARQKQPRLF